MEALLAADASLLSHKARGHRPHRDALGGGGWRQESDAMALEHEGRRQLPQQFGGDALAHGGEQRAGVLVEWLLTRRRRLCRSMTMATRRRTWEEEESARSGDDD